MEEVQAAITARNLEPDQWRNGEEWHLVSRRWRQLLKKNSIDRQIYFVYSLISDTVSSAYTTDHIKIFVIKK
jgi:hypothetical protein